MKRKPPRPPSEVLRLRLELQYVEPLIWREVEVSASMSLKALHRVIQVLMQWEECHLWAFQADGRRFEPSHDDAFDLGEPAEDPAKTTLEKALEGAKSPLLYNYDFGDDWLVSIQVVSTAAPEPGVRYPRCMAGERAGPLEDSGGPPGYEHMLKVRKKPKSREAKELLEWTGEDWDPDEFDLDSINQELAGLPAPRRLH